MGGQLVSPFVAGVLCGLPLGVGCCLAGIWGAARRYRRRVLRLADKVSSRPPGLRR